MFKLFEFKGGKFTTLPDLSPKKIRNAIIGSIIALVIVALSGRLHISEKDLWKFYNLLLQQFGINGEQFRPKNEKEIDSRIEIGVDKAIQDATPEYDRIIQRENSHYAPRIIDLTNDESVCHTNECKSLAPPMEICAPWWDGCPDSSKSVRQP